MKRYDLAFLLLATFGLLAGVLLGIYMAMSQDFLFRPVHAHINLVGWASLALYGLVYRAWPELNGRALARWHLLLSGSGAIVLPIGIAVAITAHSPGLAMAGAFLWLGGVLLFLAQLFSLVRPADPS